MENTEKYKFSFGGFKGVHPDEAAKALLDIQHKYGELKPEYVIKEAKSSRHVLHKCFTWEDEKAATNWRVQEARVLIANLLVAQQGRGGKVVYTKAFVNIRKNDAGELTNNPYTATESSYLEIGDVLADPALRQYTLQRAYRELESFTRKYNNIRELTGIINTIKQYLPKEEEKEVA